MVSLWLRFKVWLFGRTGTLSGAIQEGIADGYYKHDMRRKK